MNENILKLVNLASPKLGTKIIDFSDVEDIFSSFYHALFWPFLGEISKNLIEIEFSRVTAV